MAGSDDAFMQAAVQGVAVAIGEGIGAVGDCLQSSGLVVGPSGGGMGGGVAVGTAGKGAVGAVLVGVGDSLVESVNLLDFGEALEVTGPVSVLGMGDAATGDGFESSERVVGIDEVWGGVAVGLVGVGDGFQAATIVVIIGGEDSPLPGAGFEASGIGVGVVGAFAIVVFLALEEATIRAVDPGGGGSGGAVGGEGLLAVGVVVGVGGAVGLAAGGFLNVAVGEVEGLGDVGEVVAGGVEGVGDVRVY